MAVMAILNPCPSSPMRLCTGTRQSSKSSSAVSEARMPSLSSVLPTVNHRVARAHPGDLLERDDVRLSTGAAPAPALRDDHAHQAELAHPLDRLVREARVAVDLGGDGPDLGLGELPRRGLDELLLGRQVERHVVFPFISPGAS